MELSLASCVRALIPYLLPSETRKESIGRNSQLYGMNLNVDTLPDAEAAGGNVNRPGDEGQPQTEVQQLNSFIFSFFMCPHFEEQRFSGPSYFVCLFCLLVYRKISVHNGNDDYMKLLYRELRIHALLAISSTF